MNADDIKKELLAVASVLALVGKVTGNQALILAANGMYALVNSAEFASFIVGINNLKDLWNKVRGWLRGNSHEMAAVYLETMGPATA